MAYASFFGNIKRKYNILSKQESFQDTSTIVRFFSHIDKRIDKLIKIDKSMGCRGCLCKDSFSSKLTKLKKMGR